MSAIELAERLAKEIQSGARLDWKGIRKEIVDEHERATNMAERILCLSLYKVLMDVVVERQNISEPKDLEEFKTLRAQEYRLMLIREETIGRTDGLIDPKKMAEITRREVAEGRMAADDDFHTLAVSGAEAPTPVAKSKRASFLPSWLRRRP
jgi:hypothetical protein